MRSWLPRRISRRGVLSAGMAAGSGSLLAGLSAGHRAIAQGVHANHSPVGGFLIRRAGRQGPAVLNPSMVAGLIAGTGVMCGTAMLVKV